MLSRDKLSSLLWKVVTNGREKFYNIGTWSNHGMWNRHMCRIPYAEWYKISQMFLKARVIVPVKLFLV
jgi:hypothetical protein